MKSILILRFRSDIGRFGFCGENRILGKHRAVPEERKAAAEGQSKEEGFAIKIRVAQNLTERRGTQ